MTWAWETVREDACRYYAAGHSLTEVKRFIRNKKPGFNPSDRAYRLKFNEWNIKRPRTTRAGTSKNLRREWQPDTPGRADLQSRAGRQIAHSDVSSVTDSTSRRDTVHHRAHISHGCSCCVEELERQARVLFACPEDRIDQLDLSYWIAIPLDCEKIDQMIHLLTRDLKWTQYPYYSSILACVCSRMDSMGLSVDEKDCDGMTSLEISIRVGNVDALRVLLEHGSSFEPCYEPLYDDEDGQTLSDALWQCPNIGVIAGILRHLKRTNSSHKMPFWSLGDQIVQAIDTILSGSDDVAGLQDVYFVIANLHTERKPEFVDAVIDPQLRVLLSMLENWNSWRLSSSTIDGKEWAFERLDDLLRIEMEDNTDFWVPFWSGRLGDNCQCWSATSYVVSHIGSHKINRMLLARPTPSRKRDLVRAVLDTCPLGQQRYRREHFSDILRQVSEGLDLDDGQLRSHLGTIVSETSEDLMARCWDILVGQGNVEIHVKISKYGVSLADSVLDIDMDEPRIWQAAELVLPHDPGFPPSLRDREDAVLFNAHRFRNATYSYYASNAYLDYLCHWRTGECKAGFDHYQEPTEPYECGCHTLFKPFQGFPWGNPMREWQRKANSAVIMQRCVIHVVTRDLCKQTSLFAPVGPLSQRIQSALQLRQQFKLPDLVIEPGIVLQALSGTGATRYPDHAADETNGESGGEPATALDGSRDGIYQSTLMA